MILVSSSPVALAQSLDADFAVPSFPSMQAKNFTLPEMSVWLKAHTVASSQSQFISSMHAPVTERTAGLRLNDAVVLKSAKTLRKSPDPNCLHPGQREPK